MQQISARSDNFDIIQHSDQPTIVLNQHLTSEHKSLSCQQNLEQAVLPDPFSARATWAVLGGFLGFLETPWGSPRFFSSFY